MAKNYLNDVYSGDTNDSRELYASWAATYDEEVQKNGYETPKRIACALKDVVTDQSDFILDYGCGTGLSGYALKEAGFENIDGLDVSKEMVRLAEKKSIYRNLKVFDPSTDIPIDYNQYKIITAIGVIGAGAAPLRVFDSLFALLPQNGLFAFHLMTTRSTTQIMRKKLTIVLGMGEQLCFIKVMETIFQKLN